MADFDVVATVPVVITDDLEAGRAAVAGYTALYLGGMGSREQNFYHRLARSMGFDEAADRIQDLYLQGRPRDAADAVPFDLVDATALVGMTRDEFARKGRVRFEIFWWGLIGKIVAFSLLCARIRHGVMMGGVRSCRRS